MKVDARQTLEETDDDFMLRPDFRRGIGMLRGFDLMP